MVYEYTAEIPFNISMESLKRVNGLILDIQKYTVNHHVIGAKNNLYELVVESSGFMNSVEWNHIQTKWKRITDYKIELKEDSLEYDSGLWEALNDLRVYIIKKLYAKKILFLSNTRVEKLDRTREKYGLKKREQKEQP